MDEEAPPKKAVGAVDDPVVGADEIPTRGGPSGGGWGLLAAALVVGVVLFVSTGWGGPEPPDGTQPEVPVTSSTTTTIERPSVSVPVIAPEGELVNDTLHWVTPSGLDEATQIGGVVRFEDAYWIAGSTREGLAMWRAAQPQGPWEQHATIDRAPGWGVSDVEAAHGMLWVTALPYNPQAESGAVYESSDGRRWERHILDSSDPELPLAHPVSVAETPEGIVVSGRITFQARIESHLELLADPVQQLVEAGYADAAVVGNEVRAWILPGLEIGRAPLPDGEEVPSDTATMPPERTRVWLGGDDGFRPYTQVPVPMEIQARSDGTLLGIGASRQRLMVSEDGTGWQRFGPFDAFVGDFAEWEDGAVTISGQGGLEHWRDGHDQGAPIFPRVLDEYRPNLSQVDTGSWGMAVLTAGPEPGQTPTRRMVAESDGTQLWLSGRFQLELAREDETIWTANPPDTEVEAEEGLQLRFGEGDDSIVVDAEVWNDTATQAMMPIATTMSLAHTEDAQTWSVTDWEDITGRTQRLFPRLFDGGDFLLVAEQATYPKSQLNSVAVGIR